MRFIVLLSATIIAYAISPENTDKFIASINGIYGMIMLLAITLDIAEYIFTPRPR